MPKYSHFLKRFSSAWRSDSLGGRIIRSSLGSSGLRIVASLLGLATSVLLARLLGVEQFGVYSYALALISTLTIPVYLGIPALVVREVAIYQERKEWGKLRGLVRRAHQMILIFSAIVALGGYAYINFWGADNRNLIDGGTLMVGFILLPLMALSEIRGAILRGLHYIATGMFPDQVVRPGVMVILLGGILLGGLSLTSMFAMTLNVVATALAMVLGVLLLRARLPSQSGSALPVFETRQWAKSLLPFTLLAGVGTISSQADILLLGKFVTSEDIGLYRVAAQLSSLVAFGTVAVNYVLAPHAARLYAQGDVRRLERMFVVSAQATALLALPLVLVLFFAGDTVLGLMFGERFHNASQALAILTLCNFLPIIFGSTVLSLCMTGHERSVLIATLVGLAFFVILGILLIPHFGIIGAAFASGGGMIAEKALSLWFVHTKLKIRISAFNLFVLRKQ